MPGLVRFGLVGCDRALFTELITLVPAPTEDTDSENSPKFHSSVQVLGGCPLGLSSL